jgi:hypothetical protein
MAGLGAPASHPSPVAEAVEPLTLQRPPVPRCRRWCIIGSLFCSPESDSYYKMPDPSAPSDLEKRSTDTTPSKPLKFSVLRLAIAFVIAGASDVTGASLAPPIGWAVDVVTAALLFVVLGWQWLLLPGLVLEAIPGVGVLPLWLSWSDCCLGHAPADNWTALRTSKAQLA